MAKVAFGSFESKADKTRVPANINESTQKTNSEVNEVTGTFE